MTGHQVIIRDNKTLRSRYEELLPGDIVVGRVRIRPGEEHLLLDMAARGVHLVPSATAQLCARSKVFQAAVLGRFMIPGTTAVYDRQDVLEAVNRYGTEATGRVVCKLDRANAGQGILLFTGIEEVYTSAVLGHLPFPFVIQPYVDRCRDIRAVFIGEFREAYTRYNPSNFRHNLHFGGSSSPCDLTGEQLDVCRGAMERAGFAYGCVDLLQDESGTTWLSEINLRGGLRGAVMDQSEYLAGIEQLHEAEVCRLQEKGAGKE